MRALLLALALLAFGAQARDEPLHEGTVIRVGDGDTVRVRPDGGGKPFLLRLQGIDAPERCQVWGEEAREALAGRLLNNRVRYSTQGKDVYHRVLGRIHLMNGEDVNRWMVQQGHAWNYRYRSNPGPYAREQKAAKAARRGLFANPASVTEPAKFRRLHGDCD
jgi:micrococcal nuclease